MEFGTMQFNSPSQELIEQSFQANDDNLLAAMAAAFGLVACSDALLEHCETTRFFEIIRTSERLSNLPWKEIETQFENITQEILNSGHKGREDALALVAKVKSNETYRDSVISCAQIAVISNFRIQKVEERALKDVCEALGINSEEI